MTSVSAYLKNIRQRPTTADEENACYSSSSRFCTGKHTQIITKAGQLGGGGDGVDDEVIIYF